VQRLLALAAELGLPSPAAAVEEQLAEAKGDVEAASWSLQGLASQIGAPAAKGAAEPGSPPSFAPEVGLICPACDSCCLSMLTFAMHLLMPVFHMHMIRIGSNAFQLCAACAG
jgi:hypothetical protein